jgi:hypothetical protein
MLDGDREPDPRSSDLVKFEAPAHGQEKESEFSKDQKALQGS